MRITIETTTLMAMVIAEELKINRNNIKTAGVKHSDYLPAGDSDPSIITINTEQERGNQIIVQLRKMQEAFPNAIHQISYVGA